jgi:hypothetical protein
MLISQEGYIKKNIKKYNKRKEIRQKLSDLFIQIIGISKISVEPSG